MHWVRQDRPRRPAGRRAHARGPERRAMSDSGHSDPRAAPATGAPPSLTSPRPFRVIGTRVAKLDAIEKVTGAVQYLPDLEMPGLAWGKILRTCVPHARITRIDTTRAEALPGVLGVVTGRNVEQHPFG